MTPEQASMVTFLRECAETTVRDEWVRGLYRDAANMIEDMGKRMDNAVQHFECWQGETIPVWNDEFFRAGLVRQDVRRILFGTDPPDEGMNG